MTTRGDNARVVSLSGAGVFHHGQPDAWRPPATELCLAQISAHVERHLGKIETVFHENVSDTVHLDVLVVPATETFPFVRLVTSGMSDLPMSVPCEADAPRFLELMVTLPADWKLDMQSFAHERWYWPVRMLKRLALLPHKHATWLGWGHTVPNGDPAEPYADGVGFDGALVISPLTVPDAFHVLDIDADKAICFMAVVPLYGEEMALKLRHGTDGLLDAFDDAQVNDIVLPGRPNAGKPRARGR